MKSEAVNLQKIRAALRVGAVIVIAFASQNLLSAQQTPTPEEVHPAVSAGTAAFGTLLVGRLAADQITSHGIDLGKLTENLLNLLESKQLYFSRGEIESVINGARIEHPLRMADPATPPTARPEPPKQ